MRDPDLVVRAQQAATALESAWCHWRGMHGLGADSQPAVSSYVGYSLEAPWGQPRIIFGVSAEEAEQLAVLLDRHDCVGPVHASVGAKPVGATSHDGPSSQAADPARNGGPAHSQPEGGVVRVPAPAPASAGQQPLPAGATATARPPVPRARRRRDVAVTALTSPSTPGGASVGTPIAWAASRAVEAALASRRNAANGQQAAQRQATERKQAVGGSAEAAPEAGDHAGPAAAQPGASQAGPAIATPTGTAAGPMTAAPAGPVCPIPGHPGAGQDQRSAPGPVGQDGRTASSADYRDEAAGQASGGSLDTQEPGSHEPSAQAPETARAAGDGDGDGHGSGGNGSDGSGSGGNGSDGGGNGAAIVPGIVPFRPRSEPGSQAGRAASYSYGGALPGGAAAAAAAETVTWTAGEVPGQAAITDTAV
jgi:uncharacterized membrane protein YgcG